MPEAAPSMTSVDPERNPIVAIKGGKVFANSRDVAAFFGKRHDNVMRDIRSALAETKHWGVLNFEETPYLEPSNGQHYQSYDMTKNGFTYLVQGYTGAKAAAFKIAYIEQFDAMEEEIRRRVAAIPNLSDPVVLVQLLTEHASKRIEAEQRAAAAERVAGAAKETVEAFDRIAGSAGSLCITDAAKALQLRPKDLFGWLRSHGWIYSRVGHAGDIAYQDKIKTGYLEHKVTTVTRNDGSDKTVERVRVTPKGLAKLAKDIPGATPPSAPSAMIAAE